jgi:HU domain fused to wHTH, Ig, or Glycine-rich motif
LGDLGSFWIRVAAAGEATEGDVHAASVTNILQRFTPDKRFQRALDAIEFEKA